ncbi:alpha-hydroxy acid oxidase [Ktedonobacter robiniae]|uniref:Alpha-hydroxy-acid oxidizing enzyme n=1 Tax=Ktedonobacter robiniae TaxID=2778365 RepID=A0ABQ3V5E8_9CHLR|nr:alpha-hydroxy acid oxidase [Ktedonobacter robiniae]GHO60099.1 alpha-hydroxy-acid oxidizing enzyme [Ktedonobacter robiniae]
MMVKPLNVFEYEKQASEHLEQATWDFYQGGSDDEVTLRRNRLAFESIRLRPRVLTNVSTIDMRTTVLGCSVQMPLLVAPTAFHCLAHSDGECATARAVDSAGSLMTVATFATRSLETVAEVCDTNRLWLQLYVYRDLAITEELVRRAEAAGYRAIVLTVDAPRLGRRERDIRNAFTLPATMSIANFAAPAYSGNYIPEPTIVTWQTLEWLRTVTTLPIVLKGILTGEDAQLAVEHGVDGIIVSNHGGRQLDGTIASIEALPEVVEAVDGRCEVYCDGGIRRGTDVLKALALGARAVFVGRPVLWGLTVDGEEGARHVLHLLREELELAMSLAGCSTLQAIHSSVVTSES